MSSLRGASAPLFYLGSWGFLLHLELLLHVRFYAFREAQETTEPIMLELVFTVCSFVEGAKCRELPPVPLQEETVMIVCMIASQIEGAKWADTYPNFWIQRATCQPAGKFAKL
jgi:hypothetical protein